jgi:tRNA-splicing ligase RtcB
MNKINDKIIAFLPTESIEPKAMEQLQNISELPFLFKHVAVMPDCHLGKGATVGSVVATKGAIVPACVGVDIGCGMIAVKTKFKREDLPADLSKIRLGIERRIPLSAGAFNHKITETAQKRIDYLKSKAQIDYSAIDSKWEYALGSLGSGNHFVEITIDEEGVVWAFLHSGSRGIGNKIAMKHIEIAQGLMEKYHIKLKDKDLAYLAEGTPEFDAYIRDMNWAQEFALLNREEMMDRVLTELSYTMYGEDRKDFELERINCHHNFTQMEHHFGQNIWLTRKGSILASEGTLGLIPGSMGTKSYVVRGLGNPMSFNSAPHGAGRNFSRTEARRRFTMADLEKAMEGKEWRKTEAFIDELPGAYKDIDVVMENAKELVKIEHVFNQIINVKGD